MQIIKSIVLLIPLFLLATFVNASEKTVESKQPSQEVIKLCSSCHGVNGNSTDARWPNLASLNKNYIKKQLLDFKEGRRENVEMAELIKTIPEETIDKLAYYFSSKTVENVAPIKQEKKNGKDTKLVNKKLGKEIFDGKRVDYGIPGCLHCHGNNAEGNKDGKYPRLLGQHEEYIKKQLQLFRAKERTNDVPSTMQNTAMMMDDEDIASVAAYISSLNR